MRLVDSIASQSYSNIEIVIVDDASTDDTASAVSAYMQERPNMVIEYFKNETNRYVGETKKRAYRECTGDVIVFSDDDDYYIDDDYFRCLSSLYLSHEDCVMTIAPTLTRHGQEGDYDLSLLNIGASISTVEYLNGFMTKYRKPSSMFTMSMRATSINEVGYGELLYFNDTSLYLFGLMAGGDVYALDKAVGVYYVSGMNMTGDNNADYILRNLESKYDIFLRANRLGVLHDSDRWLIDQLSITADSYLATNRNVSKDDRAVWKWVKAHFSAKEYLTYDLHVLSRRARGGLPIDLRLIPLSGFSGL